MARTRSTQLSTQVVSGWQGVSDALAEDWRDLHGDPETVGASLFNGFDYLDVWQTHFGSADVQPLVLAVRDGKGRLCGLAPFQIAERSRGKLSFRRLGFIKNRHVSRSGVLMRGNRGAVARAMAHRLWCERPRFDDVVFEGMPVRCPAQIALRQAMEADGFRTDPAVGRAVVRSTDMQAGRDAYLASRSKRVRQDVRRAFRRCEALPDFGMVSTDDPARLRTRLRHLFSLDWMSRRHERPGKVYHHTAKSFYLGLSERPDQVGRMSFVEALTEGEVVASIMSITSLRRRFLLVTYADAAYDFASPGRRVILEAVAGGVADPEIDAVDFNGDTPLLEQLGEGVLETATFRATHSGGRSRLIGLGRAIKAQGEIVMGPGDG